MIPIPFPRLRVAAVVASLATEAFLSPVSVPAADTVLGLDGSRFTLNGEPRFLLGFSYYAALGAPREFVLRDLDDMKGHGFNWLRVWASWGGFGNVVAAVDEEGRAREPFLEKLRWLVAECDARGMIVDVTLSRRESDPPEEARGEVPDAGAHLRAVETIVRGLAPHRNWYLDLANERDVGDSRFVGPEELRKLRGRARELDPDLLVTASFGGHDLGPEDVREALGTIGVDFLAPHRPRHAGCPAETRERTEAALALAREAGRLVPVHYQEPFRRGYTDWQPGAEDFLEDLRGALAGGAAGWCFHNGSQRGVEDERPRRSFDLRDHRLMDQLDGEEREFVRRAARLVRP